MPIDSVFDVFLLKGQICLIWLLHSDIELGKHLCATLILLTRPQTK